MCYELTGVNINQEDVPWWVVQIFNWIDMVNALYNAFGKDGKHYRDSVHHMLSKGRPMQVYKIYKSYTLYVKTL